MNVGKGDYVVDKVGGAPFINAFNKTKTGTIDSVVFEGKTVVIESTSKKQKVRVIANYDRAKMFFESNINECGQSTQGIYSRDFIIDLKLEITDFTIADISDPVGMTLDEIEKELGYKVFIVNNKEKA